MLAAQLGQVIKSDPLTNSVDIKSFFDGSVIRNVTLDSDKTDQELPPVKSTCYFIRDGNYITKIIKTWSSLSGIEKVNPGERAMTSGEGTKGSSVSVTMDGVAKSRNGTGTGTIYNMNGKILLEDDVVVIRTLNNIEINLDQDGTIRIVKFDSQDEKKLIAAIIITPLGQIQIDGISIFLGPGAVDQLKRQLFGDIVTSGPFGTYPFDFLTGLPIPGSLTIKAAS